MTRVQGRGWAPLVVVSALALVLAGCGSGASGNQDTDLPHDETALAAATTAPTNPPPAPTATARPAPVATLPPPAATATPPPDVGQPPPTDAAPASPTPRPAPPPDNGSGRSQVHEYGDSGRQEIALTFDAGADRGNAEGILDLLRDRGLKASFGMTGQWASENPDLVQRMVAEGHMLINHTWTHRSFTGFSPQTPPLTTEERLKELRDTEDLIRELTGYDLRPYFRPPYGDFDQGTLVDLADAGYTMTIMWSCDTRDSVGASAAEVLVNCFEGAQPGGIILLHVGSQSPSFDVLPAALDSLAERGFALVTVEEILQP